eukprot:142691-Pleurochrysis_carterae.AAC.2
MSRSAEAVWRAECSRGCRARPCGEAVATRKRRGRVGCAARRSAAAAPRGAATRRAHGIPME